MKNTFTLIILCLFINGLYSQITFRKVFANTYLARNCFVTPANDGGYAVAGATGNFGAGGFDAFLMRTDSAGNVLWVKTYGGTNDEAAYDIKQTSDSGFIITGSTESFGGTRNYPNLYLIRTDKNGDTLWTRTYGDPAGETGQSVQQTEDSGFITVGNWDNTGYLFAVRTKSNSDTLWTTVNDGGYGAGVIENADKGFTISGTNYINADANEMFLYRTDSAGNTIWYKTYGGTNTEGGYGLAKGNDGGFITVGFTASFVQQQINDAYVVKTDSAGNVIWSKSYEGLTGIQGYSVISTGDGYVLFGNEVFVTGFFEEGLLIKIDNSGNVLWARNYIGMLVGNVKQTTDGGFVLTGYSQNSTTLANNCYLIKTDSLGRSGCDDSVATVTVDTAATITNTILLTPLGGALVVVGSSATIISDSAMTSTVDCISTGLEDEITGGTMKVTAFPNPALDNVTITTDPDFGLIRSVDFYNVLGQHVMESTQTKNINVAPLPAAGYFIKVTNTEGVTSTVRFEKF